MVVSDRDRIQTQVQGVHHASFMAMICFAQECFLVDWMNSL